MNNHLARWVAAAGFVISFAPSAAAQFGERTGPEFQVNSSVGGGRSRPRAGMAADGRLFVVWTGAGSDGYGSGIVGRRFDSGGVPEAIEFLVNTTVANDQSLPEIAMNAAGAAVVVWQSNDQDGSGSGIYAQRYDAAGAVAGLEFRVNTTVLGDQVNPSVAMDGLGRFVVCWSGATSSGAHAVFGQRFDAFGGPAGVEFKVGDVGTSATSTAVAMNAAGRFVIGWADGAARARSFEPSGAALSPSISTFPLAYPPRVGIDDLGQFVLVFGDGAGGPSQAAFFDANGTLRTRSSLPSEFYWNPSVATNGAGDSVVTGASIGRIYAQTFTVAGDPRTWPSLANPTTASNNYPPYPSSAIGGPGLSVVVWQQALSTGVADIFAQRFGRPVPPPPASFHTLTPCRLVDTRVYPDLLYGRLTATPRLLTVAGKCGLPVTAKAVAANVTVTQPEGGGHLSFLPGSGSGDAPVTSALNYGPGQTRGNNAVLPLSTGGELRLRAVQASGATHFILDVVGYFE